MCKVYTGYHGTSEIEHGFCACTVDNPLAKARGLSLRTGGQTMLYLSLVHAEKSSVFHCGIAKTSVRRWTSVLVQQLLGLIWLVNVVIVSTGLG